MLEYNKQKRPFLPVPTSYQCTESVFDLVDTCERREIAAFDVLEDRFFETVARNEGKTETVAPRSFFYNFSWSNLKIRFGARW